MTDRRTDATATPTTRTKRDPRAVAQAALDVVDRKIARLTAAVKTHQDDAAAASAERDALIRRREYLAAHPDLADSPTDDDTPTTTT